MLFSKSSHLSCAFSIQDYLEFDGERERALGHDFVNLYTELERRRWAETMDRTRRMHGNDASWRGKQAVTYQHFMISPDPADGCDLDTLRSLALEWVHEFFGTEDGEAGVLGNYEVAIVYHDDNERGIPHAHVVVNNTDLDTGRRLHIDANESKLLADRLQDMARERGLSFFDNSKPKHERVRRGSFVTRAERRRIAEGKWCYKQDLRDMVDIARRAATNEAEFVSSLEKMGAGVRANANDDWVYVHPKNPTLSVSGYRLGKAYSRDMVAYSMRDASRRRNPETQHAALAAEGHIASYIAQVKTIASVAAWTELSDAAFALRVNERYNVQALGEYDRVGGVLLKEMQEAERAGDTQGAKQARDKLTELAKARAIAKETGLLDGAPERSHRYEGALHQFHQEKVKKRRERERRQNMQSGSAPKKTATHSQSKGRSR